MSVSEDYVFLATPPGRGGIGVILVQGPGALARVEPFIRTRRAGRLADLAEGELLYGYFVHQGRRLDEVIVRVERRPDVHRVEIDCHGGPAPTEAILTALAGAGARRIAWNDERAADPALAPLARQAWQCLPLARTWRTARHLLAQQAGALQRAVEAILEAIRAGRHAEAAARLEALAGTYAIGRHLTQPWRVALGGRPNVGKSTLANRLIGWARSLVSPEPGTTRDALAEPISLDGWPILIVDTAGLGLRGNELDEAAAATARSQIAQADLWLLLVDRSRPLEPEDHALLAASRLRPSLTVVSKADLPAVWAPEIVGPHLLVSGLTGAGLEHLTVAIVERLVPQPPAVEDPLVFTQFQHDWLTQAAARLAVGQPAEAIQALEEMVRSTGSAPAQGGDVVERHIHEQ